MKNSSKYVWGIVLIAIAVLWILDILGFIHINSFFFRGWWTLLIIIPSVVALGREKDKAGPMIGIAVGVLLLLGVRGIIDWGAFWKLVLACLMLVIGLSLIFANRFREQKELFAAEQISRDGKNVRKYETAFGEKQAAVDGDVFEGADVKVSFASFQLDLRNAIIREDCVIRLDCSFAGTQILLPP
ncbi:MAG TPA: hypothetical protein DDX33_05850, partial [Rikenellaceae bacterium]|nr:hypothetical protein [Rikenellaceae bacterium]